jgi:hypothetical protein
VLLILSERHGVRRLAQPRIELVAGQVRLERIHESRLSLLRRNVDGLLFNFDGTREVASFGGSSGERVEDRGILSVSERLCAIREGQAVRAIAGRRVGTGCEQAGGEVQIGDTIGIGSSAKRKCVRESANLHCR